MSEILSSVKKACVDALDTVKELCASAPGSRTSQALVVGAVVGAVAYFLLKKRERLPPGPFPLPLLGNLLSVSSKKEPFYVTLKRWAVEKYGPVITIYFGPVCCVVLNQVDVVMEALVQRGADFAGRPQLYSFGVMSEGFKDILFASESAAWKLHRKIATQALRNYMRGQHLETVVHEVVAMIMDKMAAEPEAFDPHSYMSILMFHVTDTICFGKVKGFNDSSLTRLSQIFDSLTQDAGNGFLEDVLPLLRHFPTRKFQKFSDGIQEFLDYIYAQIDEHRETFSQDNIRDIVDSVLLAQMEAEKEESAEVMAMFTSTHVGETISDIFGGGVDTSRQTLDWVMLFMAGHPEEQSKVQAEIDMVTGSRLPGVADRAKLVYTEAALYEIMRLGTVAPLGVPHQTLCDTSVGGYDIPQNTMVFINHWALLNDPKEWDSPREFRPSRFINEAGKLKSKVKSWLPFSAGRRACLGEFVAKPELLLIFACIMKRFKVSLPAGAVFDPSPQTGSMVLHIPKPYKIIVTERV